MRLTAITARPIRRPCQVEACSRFILQEVYFEARELVLPLVLQPQAKALELEQLAYRNQDPTHQLRAL